MPGLEIQYYGHSFFRIGFPERNILIDPYITSTTQDSAFRRMVKCPVTERGLKDIAIILITHEHFDHFDKKLIESVAARDNACVVAHDEILKELHLPRRSLHAVSMNETITLRNVSIRAMPAHHPKAFYPLGYLISYNNTSVLHAGDTDLIDDFAEIKPDIALLPIGGTYTMDCVDAVRAVKTMKPKYAVPMHYNTFKMIEQDPNEFKHRIEKSILKTKPVVLAPGQCKRFKF